MIHHLPTWTFLRGADYTILASPEGIEAAFIRYEENLRPLRPLPQLIADHLSSMSVPVAVGPIELITTDEGEYGGLVTVGLQTERATVQRDIGFVFCSDSYATISGVATRPDLFARSTHLVRELVKTNAMWLGLRRRLVLYSPPKGWRGVARGMDAHWYPPQFPRDGSRITAWPAVPEVNTSPESVFAQLQLNEQRSGFAVDDVAAPVRVATASDLSLSCWQLTGQAADGLAVVREFAVATDERYVYVFRLESIAQPGATPHRATFHEMLQSVQPTPPPGTNRAAVVFSHWAE